MTEFLDSCYHKRRGSRYDDGGCGIPGPWDGCGFHCWLDDVIPLPDCHCGTLGRHQGMISGAKVESVESVSA